MCFMMTIIFFTFSYIIYFFQDSITEQNKVVLISAKTQFNINKEIEKLINNGGEELKIHSNMYACGNGKIITLQIIRCSINYQIIIY